MTFRLEPSVSRHFPRWRRHPRLTVESCGYCGETDGYSPSPGEEDRGEGGRAQSIYCQPDNQSGFTLIEVVIAASLMALILISAYACLSAGYATQKIIEPRSEVIQNARVAMALMAADLRAACPLSPDSEFVGMMRTVADAEADNLDFATHNYTPRHPQEGDYCQESFFVDKDTTTGALNLYRRRNPIIALDPLSGGSREEIARSLRGLKFEYYDGLEWYDSWGETKTPGKASTSSKVASNLSGLPTAVRITLYLDPNPHRTAASGSDNLAPAQTPEPPLVFQTVARLNLAEASAAAASSGASDANASPDASGSPNGNNQ